MLKRRQMGPAATIFVNKGGPYASDVTQKQNGDTKRDTKFVKASQNRVDYPRLDDSAVVQQQVPEITVRKTPSGLEKPIQPKISPPPVVQQNTPIKDKDMSDDRNGNVLDGGNFGGRGKLSNEQQRENSVENVRSGHYGAGGQNFESQKIDLLQAKKSETQRLLRIPNIGDSSQSFDAKVLPNDGKETKRADKKVSFSASVATSSEQFPLVTSSKTTTQNDEETRWQSYVDRGRKIVGKLNQHRLEVAELAIAACNIKHGGGGHWTKFQGVYTLKRFAEEIGINPKTLSNWVRVKQNVIDQLPPGLYKEEDWGAAQRTSDRTPKRTHKKLIEKAFREWREKKDPTHYLMQGIRRMRSTAYFLENKADFGKIDQALVEELMKLSKKIHTVCKQHRETK